MKKKTKLIPLIVDRKKWARGGYNGNSALRNDEDNMCCLGFACRAVNIPAKKLKNVGTPQTLVDQFAKRAPVIKQLGKMLEGAAYTQDRYLNSDETDRAVAVNDDEYISDKLREYRLKPILKKLGFAVKFTGPTREE